jgi:hypothetical protein
MMKYNQIRCVSGTPWYSAGHITPMSDFFHFIVRPAEVLLGLFCLLTAYFLHRDEEGKIQSAMEETWVRIDDYQHVALIASRGISPAK